MAYVKTECHRIGWIRTGKEEEDDEFDYDRGSVCSDRRGAHLSCQGKAAWCEMRRMPAFGRLREGRYGRRLWVPRCETAGMNGIRKTDDSLRVVALFRRGTFRETCR